jgi:hypothetical protein
MEQDFETEDMKRVFSSIMMRLQEAESAPFLADISLVEKPTEKSTEVETPEATPFPKGSMYTGSKSAKKINAKSFQETTLARMNLQTQKKIEDIKKKQEISKAKEIKDLKQKPDINPNSKKMGKRNQPVHERAEKEIAEAKKKIEETKKKLAAEKEAKILPDLTFKPKLNNTYNGKRDIQDFFQYTQEWKNRSIKRIERKKAELEEKINSELKFCPEIDEKSADLIGQIDKQKPIEIRLIERHEFSIKKKEAKRKEASCSFTPTIEPRSRKIVARKKRSDIFNRLYSLSIEPPSQKSPRFGTKKNKSFSFSNDNSKSIDVSFNNI